MRARRVGFAGGASPSPTVREWSSCADGSPHAQAPSVPIRRAGRRARDKIWVLPTALGGEKSPSGRITGPSVAPHLRRKFVREVRSEFSWTAAFASEAIEPQVRQLLFVTFSFWERKKCIVPREGKWSSCAEGRLCGIYGSSKPLPYRGGMEFVRGRKFPRTRRTVEDACPYKRK